MEEDRESKEQRRQVIEDFMRFAEMVQEESDARRAVSGEPAKTVLVGVDPEQGRLVIVDPGEGSASVPEEPPSR